MSSEKTITCSFKVNKDIYNAYKSIVSSNGEYVKGNLIRHMLDVIKNEEPNLETIKAIEEVEKMKSGKIKTKTYTDIDLMFEEILS